MKPPLMNREPEDDEEFIASLRQFSLRPPPANFRGEMLAAFTAPAVAHKPWHRSLFWRGMAALWGVSIALWADTQRLAPVSATASSAPPMDFSPASQPDIQSLLATLASENRRRPLLP